jgi:hypothetical protein
MFATVRPVRAAPRSAGVGPVHKGAVIVENGIELFRLYQRKSASGKTYFIGRLGNARIAVLKDNEAPLDETTLGVWRVIVQHRDPDRANNRDHRPTPAPAQQATARTPARAKARPASVKRSMPDATKRAIEDIHRRYPGELNDDIPEL